MPCTTEITSSRQMHAMDFLQTILGPHFKPSHYPELLPYFEEFSEGLIENNWDMFENFLEEQDIQFENRDDLTQQLLKKIYNIESQIQNKWNLKDWSQESTLENLWNQTQNYIPPLSQAFLTNEGAHKLLENHPLESNIKSTDSLFKIATCRYTQSEQWHNGFLESLTLLTPQDFQKQKPKLYIVSHKEFPQLAQTILQKKCFSTHDKITGSHIMATLPNEFNLKEKCPALRTFCKIAHYQQEIDILGQAFKKISFFGIWKQVIQDHSQSHLQKRHPYI